MNVVHLTSVHSRFDTRIYYKQCLSLEKAGYSVSLIVADGKGEEVKDNINIYDVGVPQGRLNRIFKISKKIFNKAVLLNADVYHLHDPELIPSALKLRKLGKIVIFDSHEDVSLQMRAKPYLNAPLRYLVGEAYGLYERYACKKISAVITATPFIRDKFIKINPNTIDVNNFPIINELKSEANWESKEKCICYIGGIGTIRGIEEIILALGYQKSSTRLKLGGLFNNKEIEERVKKFEGWSLVDELGYLDRFGVKDVLEQSIAGLVVLHPVINYVDALPVKMFEYMSAGIPVIASNFPLWEEIIEKNNCGVCVDPLDPYAIADAIDFFRNAPDKAKQMGKNGRKTIENTYNWSIEEKKLLELYTKLNGDFEDF